MIVLPLLHSFFLFITTIWGVACRTLGASCSAWRVVLHVIFNVLDAFVEHAEGLGIHPGVVRRLIVKVGTINHKMGVRVIYVVDDVILRHNG